MPLYLSTIILLCRSVTFSDYLFTHAHVLQKLLLNLLEQPAVYIDDMLYCLNVFQSGRKCTEKDWVRLINCDITWLNRIVLLSKKQSREIMVRCFLSFQLRDLVTTIVREMVNMQNNISDVSSGIFIYLLYLYAG